MLLALSLSLSLFLSLSRLFCTLTTSSRTSFLKPWYIIESLAEVLVGVLVAVAPPPPPPPPPLELELELELASPLVFTLSGAVPAAAAAAVDTAEGIASGATTAAAVAAAAVAEVVATLKLAFLWSWLSLLLLSAPIPLRRGCWSSRPSGSGSGSAWASMWGASGASSSSHRSSTTSVCVSCSTHPYSNEPSSCVHTKFERRLPTGATKAADAEVGKPRAAVVEEGPADAAGEAEGVMGNP